jgi:hypothetical protein
VTPEERRARAIRMAALLDDPEIQDAFKSIEADLMNAWKNAFDPAERENLWRTVNLIERLQTWMRSAASHDLTALRRAK